MKTSPLIVLALALVGLASCKTAPPAPRAEAHPAAGAAIAQPAAAPAPDAYILGPADSISITVWRNTELSKSEIPIDPFGMISMPLIGTVKASGLTADQLKQRIEAKLAKYLVNPQVDVFVASVKGSKAYVLGEAKTPGPVTLDHAVSAFEAIMLSGGFSSDANQSRVLLVRNRDGKVNFSALDLNVADDNGRQQVAKATRLEPGDVLYVMPLRIASVATFMSRLNTILGPLIGIESGTVLAPQAWDVVSGKSQSSSQSATVAISASK